MTTRDREVLRATRSLLKHDVAGGRARAFQDFAAARPVMVARGAPSALRFERKS
jgi:hypothetical protein